MIRLTIDPGSGGTGIAAWEISSPGSWIGSELPQAVTCLNSSEKDWKRKTEDILSSLENIIDGFGLRLEGVWVEWPRFMESSAGMASAGEGSLVKLCFLVGGIAEQCRIHKVPFHPLPVNEWKGTLSKEAVEKRVRNAIGLSYPNHILDAVGMGLYLKGLINHGNRTRTG